MSIAAPFRSLDIVEQKINSQAKAAPAPLNNAALLSVFFASTFILYFFLPHIRSMGINMIFVVVVPLVAFVMSVVALRQIAHSHERGSVMSLAALSLVSLYFLTALAIPFVLVCIYIIYTYII